MRRDWNFHFPNVHMIRLSSLPPLFLSLLSLHSINFDVILFLVSQIQQVCGRKLYHVYVVSWHKRKVLDLVVTIAHGHYCNNNKQKPSYLIEIQVWNKIFAQKDAMDIENHDEYINSLFAFVFEGVLLLPSAWLIQSWTLYFFWT